MSTKDRFTRVEDLEIGVEMSGWTLSYKPITFKLRLTRSKYVGMIRENATGDKYKIIGNLDTPRAGTTDNFPLFLMEFEDGTRVIGNILPNLRNPNKRVIFNVACLGQGGCNTKSHPKEYQLWYSMLTRCYSETYQLEHPTYKDCSVDERWLNFQNFCEDIQSLNGYKEWKENTEPLAWALDKDIKVKGNKVYSKDTCMFVTARENALDGVTRMDKTRLLSGKTYLATFTNTGYTEDFTCIKEFARKYGLKHSAIWRCLKGLRHHHRDISFRTLTEEEALALDLKKKSV